MKKIAIIGAGPAGIFSTLLLKDFDGEVHLFEQNRDIGEKLKTTGGGRMNVTNHNFSVDEFSSCSQNLLKKIFKNPHINNRHFIFEKLGIQYQWEKNRAILASQNAVEEVSRLKKAILNQPNVTLNLEHKAIEITSQKSIKFQTTNQTKTDTFDIIILSGGGMYRMFDLGETQKIYNLPLQLGHSITEVNPSLSPLVFTDKKLRELKGISVEGRLTDTQNKRFVEDDILITHFGLSGPAVLDFSAIRESEKVECCFTTEIKEHEFREQINNLRQGKNFLRTFLKKFFSQRLTDFFLEKSDLEKDILIADLPKAKLHDLIQTIFHYPIPKFQSKNYPSSWTTKGGVKLEEIQTATLESKIIPDIYFTGEILDINGLCGGYNISWAAISAQIVVDGIITNYSS